MSTLLLPPLQNGFHISQKNNNTKDVGNLIFHKIRPIILQDVYRAYCRQKETDIL